MGSVALRWAVRAFRAVGPAPRFEALQGFLFKEPGECHSIGSVHEPVSALEACTQALSRLPGARVIAVSYHAPDFPRCSRKRYAVRRASVRLPAAHAAG